MKESRVLVHKIYHHGVYKHEYVKKIDRDLQILKRTVRAIEEMFEGIGNDIHEAQMQLVAIMRDLEKEKV